MMRKIMWVLILPIILGGCSLVSTPDLFQISINDKGRNFNFAVDKQFQIVLPANHTTGYQWEVSDLSEGNLELVSNDYGLSDEYSEDIVGAGGEETFVFKVLAVDRSRIVMKYLRSWDELDVANEFSISVNGNPDDGLVSFVGTIHSLESGSEYDDYFEVQEGEKFGIEAIMVNQLQDPGVKARIAEFKDTDTLVDIRGEMLEDILDYNNKQLIIHTIQQLV